MTTERTFASEDIRKDQLFEGWIDFLRSIHAAHDEEIFQGIASVRCRSKNRISFELPDGKVLRNIHIIPSVSKHSRVFDQMFVTVGKKDGRWIPLDVMSITSIIGAPWEKDAKVHFSINPLYIPTNPSPAGSMH